jgi:Eukaryotic aspartyl protease
MKGLLLLPALLFLSGPLLSAAAPVGDPFDPPASASFTQPSPPQSFTVSYASGEEAQGFIGNDAVSLGGFGGFSAFGGVQDTTSTPWPFTNWDGDGILGLGPGTNVERSVLWAMFGDDAVEVSGSESAAVKNLDLKQATTDISGVSSSTPTLGIVMTSSGGMLYVGGSGVPASSYAGSTLATVAVAEDSSEADTVWQLPLQSVRLGSTVLYQKTRRQAAPRDGVAVLDTGQGCIAMPGAAFSSFQSAFAAQSSQSPALRFEFSGGATIDVPFSQYVNPGNQICVQREDFFQLGDPFFRSAAVEFIFGGKGAFRVRLAQRAGVNRRNVASSPDGGGDEAADRALLATLARESPRGLAVSRRLVPQTIKTPPNNMQTKRDASMSQTGLVRYFAGVAVGSAGQEFSLLVDTGSTVMLVYSKSPVNAGLIVGLVLGSIAFVCLVGAGVFFFFRQRRKRAQYET